MTPLCTDAVQCDFHNLFFIENAEWEFLTWRKDFPDELWVASCGRKFLIVGGSCCYNSGMIDFSLIPMLFHADCGQQDVKRIPDHA